MMTQDASDSSTRVSVDLNPDRESRVLELLETEYDDPAQVAYLTDRFGYRMLLTHRYARMARVYFYAARIVVIGSGALLPAIVTLQSQSRGAAHTWLTVCAIALSVLVAIAAGLLQASRMDQRWKLYHWAWTELRNEGWTLAEQRGPYADKTPAGRFTTFVDRIEATLHRFKSAIQALAGHGSDDPGMDLSLPSGDNAAHLR